MQKMQKYRKSKNAKVGKRWGKGNKADGEKKGKKKGEKISPDPPIFLDIKVTSTSPTPQLKRAMKPKRIDIGEL